MGCPILLGYAEKAKEVANTWQMVVAHDGDDPTDSVMGMVRTAMRVRDPSRGLLHRRANRALWLIISLLRRALLDTEMKADAVILDEISEALEPVATKAVLDRINDRAIAWKVHHSVEDGMEKAMGDLQMIFTGRVWTVVNIASNLLHDMTQGSYITAGGSLAYAMAALGINLPEWLTTFERLEEVA